jgi:hypothetical protein
MSKPVSPVTLLPRQDTHVAVGSLHDVELVDADATP